jgi:hypothetical protein
MTTAEQAVRRCNPDTLPNNPASGQAVHVGGRNGLGPGHHRRAAECVKTAPRTPHRRVGPGP